MSVGTKSLAPLLLVAVASARITAPEANERFAGRFSINGGINKPSFERRRSDFLSKKPSPFNNKKEPIECGDTIQSPLAFLNEDLECDCSSGPALVLAKGATLTLKDDAIVSCTRFSEGATCIELQDSRATIKGGIIKDCDVGVAVSGKGGHRIEGTQILARLPNEADDGGTVNTGISITSDNNIVRSTFIEGTFGDNVIHDSDFLMKNQFVGLEKQCKKQMIKNRVVRRIYCLFLTFLLCKKYEKQILSSLMQNYKTRKLFDRLVCVIQHCNRPNNYQCSSLNVLMRARAP